MDIILYITIFLIGTLFGSFYTLAVYRIPKKIDIVKTHSFCPNCNHKLGFLELIPVWSYIFLGGKCKQCKQKIRPRYFILEALSGLTFVLIAVSLKLSVDTLNINLLIEIAFLVLYLVAIFLIAGIDKEKRQIEKSVLYYALGILVMYIIYLCIIDNTSIYRYVMYLIQVLILLVLDTINLKNKARNSYILSMLILLLTMIIFTGEAISILSVICTLIIIGLVHILSKINKKMQKNKEVKIMKIKELPIGFYLCVSNIAMLIMAMFIANWCK